MTEERDRKDKTEATKPDDKKLTDLAADKKDVKGGGGTKLGTGTDGPTRRMRM